MKIYEMLALSRSGHHSIMNWIIRNTIGFQCTWEYKMTNLGGTGLYYLNETNYDIDRSFKYIEDEKKYIKTLYLNYEDTPGDYTVFNHDNKFKGPMSMSIDGVDDAKFIGRVIIIRDFYNLLASRLKANENKIFKKWNDNIHLLETGEKYIYTWKSQAKSCLYNNTPYLRFEDWLNNKKVREKFLYDNFGLFDYYGTDGIFGTKSSFDTHDGVENRSKQIEIPEEIKDLIRKDNELHYLMGALGYKYKEI